MFLLLLAPLIAAALLALSYLIRELAADLTKGTAYECGFVPSYGQAYSPFAITFFLVGLLFLLFDLELLFMFPVSYSPDSQTSWAHQGACLFFACLVLSLTVEIGKKLLPSRDVSPPSYSGSCTGCSLCYSGRS